MAKAKKRVTRKPVKKVVRKITKKPTAKKKVVAKKMIVKKGGGSFMLSLTKGKKMPKGFRQATPDEVKKHFGSKVFIVRDNKKKG